MTALPLLDASAGFVLHLQHLPPSVNHMFANVAGKGRVKSQGYRTWLNAVGWDVNQQRPQPVRGFVRVHIRLGPWDKKSDIDNRVKACLDLLKTHDLIDDDRFVHDIRARWDDTIKGARVEVRPL